MADDRQGDGEGYAGDLEQGAIFEGDGIPGHLPREFIELINRFSGEHHVICVRGKLVQVDGATRLRYADRRCELVIGKTWVGETEVSTVFLDGLLLRDDLPCFETMTFGETERTRKYHTYAEAVAGHRKMVKDMQRLANVTKNPHFERSLKKWKHEICQFLKKGKRRGPRWVMMRAEQALRLIEKFGIYPMLQQQLQELAIMLVISSSVVSAGRSSTRLLNLRST